MKKSLLASLFAVAACVQAHELWVSAPAKIAADETLKGEIGYWRGFPKAEPIQQDRVHFFKPLQLIGLDGKLVQDLTQEGENQQYVAKEKIGKGVYWLVATHKPIIWSKKDKDFIEKNLKEMPDAKICKQTQRFGKSLLVVDDAPVDVAVISQPIGLVLEIVPLADPNQAKADALFPLQVFYDGKPLAGALVSATADTFVAKDAEGMQAYREPQAFSLKTDKEGKVTLIPLLEGQWKVKVSYQKPYEDPSICTEHNISSSLIVHVGK